MRYRVVDLEGNRRGAFDSREELLEELEEGAAEDPETLSSLYVYACEANGQSQGIAARGDEFLRAATAPPSIAFAEVVHMSVPNQATTETITVRSERSGSTDFALITV